MKRISYSVMGLMMMAVALAQYQPQGTVECIAPANPGGGWDFTCRSIESVLKDLNLINGQAYNVTNMAGGGGGVAMANVIENRSGDNNLIVAASTATTARLAAGEYGDYTVDSIVPLAVIGADFAAIGVSKVSPLLSLQDLVDALKADPASVTFGGGSAVGGLDHIKAMLIAQAIGVDPLEIKYVPFDGGGEAATALLGGFIDVFPGDASEILGLMESGDVRPLAVLAPERMSGPFADVPTATELGYDVVLSNWRGYYMAPGTSDEAYAYWTDVMTQVANSSQWAEIRSTNSLQPFTLIGEDAKNFVREQDAAFRELLTLLGLL